MKTSLLLAIPHTFGWLCIVVSIGLAVIGVITWIARNRHSLKDRLSWKRTPEAEAPAADPHGHAKQHSQEHGEGSHDSGHDEDHHADSHDPKEAAVWILAVIGLVGGLLILYHAGSGIVSSVKTALNPSPRSVMTSIPSAIPANMPPHRDTAFVITKRYIVKPNPNEKMNWDNDGPVQVYFDGKWHLDDPAKHTRFDQVNAPGAARRTYIFRPVAGAKTRLTVTFVTM